MVFENSTIEMKCNLEEETSLYNDWFCLLMIADEKDADSELYSMLTNKQLATVKKRVETVRTRAKSHRPDVRNIFSDHQTDGAALQSMQNAILQAGRPKANQKESKVKVLFHCQSNNCL